MTEEIINALANVEGVRVVARTSAFSFKGRNVNVREIGQNWTSPPCWRVPIETRFELPGTANRKFVPDQRTESTQGKVSDRRASNSLSEA